MPVRPRELILAVALAACGPRFERVDPPGGDTEIRVVKLSWSNAYLISDGDARALVDAGSPADLQTLVTALANVGVAPRELRVVILTHAHGDHAALAAWLQDAGAPIAVGAGDVAMAAAGEDGELHATSTLAGLLRPFIDFHYPPFTPDLVITGERDLAELGLPHVRVLEQPGHTPGSVVVLVGDGAIVGDQMLGGFLGMFGKGTPREHFYQDDPDANRANIRALLDRGVARFYLGHGGPVTREAVEAWLPPSVP